MQPRFFSRRFLPTACFTVAVLFVGMAHSLFAADASAPLSTATVERPYQTPEPPFPSFYFLDRIERAESEERARPYWVESDAEVARINRHIADFKSLLLNDDIVAFYGSPISKRMGILGRYSIPKLDSILDEWAAKYDEVNGPRGVKKAFYIIYGTVWPEGEIGILKESTLKEYIAYAQEHDALIFVDHQIGKYEVVDALKRILPFLRYPNVHLALDPEWHTMKPMEEIGSVTAEEINEAQRVMEDYIVEHGIPGERLLVIHQFNWRMIQNREQVRTDFARVRLVHCADGFGLPAVKKSTYNYNALAGNMPVKGFKLFFKSDVKGAGFDDPLMPPKDVITLDPQPYLIMYQ